MENTLNKSGKLVTAGVVSMFLSTLFFSLANICVKKVGHLPAMEIVFFRCLIGVGFCLYGIRRAGADWRGSNRTVLFFRGFFGTSALFCFFLTVQNIPLASAMTIQYLSPIFTSVISIFLLREKVAPMQWFFYALAFAGVLSIEQFDTRVSPFYLGLGIMSAFGSGMAYNLVRSLKEKEHPLTVVFHFQFIGMVAGLIVTIFNWRTPESWDWLYLVAIGVFSQLGQVFLTDALQKENAASVAIILYTGLIYGLSFGWFLFGEPQGIETLFGMLLVVAGVGASVVYGRRKSAAAEAIEATQA